MDRSLTQNQIDAFEREGHLILRGAFDGTAAEPLIEDAFRQLGCARDDPSTWRDALRFVYPSEPVRFRDFAPAAWRAALELMGGESRASSPDFGVGQWVINFHKGRDEPWQPPSASVPGWHKDGNFFRHFLDSPEQGLLVIPIFSKVDSRGGGTFVAADSVAVVARFLRGHPEGVRPDEFGFADLIAQCHDFREITGDLGDVVLVHPFLLHNFSQNHSGRARLITNMCVSLAEPMRFDRPDPEDFSPVERAVLKGLGVDRLVFAPGAPRERIDLAG